MRTRVLLPTLALFLASAAALAEGVSLELSADAVKPGEVQKLTVGFKEAGTYDVYLILSGTGGRFSCLKPDGAFAQQRKAVPFLSGLRVKKAGSLEVHSWRVTGLAAGAYSWSVVLAKEGKGILEKENRLGLDSRRFTVETRAKTGTEGGAVYSELSEGGDAKGKDGRYGLSGGEAGPRGRAADKDDREYLLKDTAAEPETARAEKQHAAALKFIRSHGLHTHLETFT